MSALDQILGDFNSDVDRIEHLLDLIRHFKEFGASSPPKSEVDQWPEARGLHEASKLRRTNLPVLSGSLQLYLVGRFEYCIRQIIESAADEIALKVGTYNDLPDEIKSNLRSKILEISQNPKRYGFDEADSNALLASLSMNLNPRSAEGNLTIASEVLGITEGNMKDRILADLTKRIGMREFWKDVGKQAKFKIVLETSEEGRTTVEAQSRLNTIMEERNQVAHPTGATSFPDIEKVSAAALFLKALAVTTIELTKVHLATFKAG